MPLKCRNTWSRLLLNRPSRLGSITHRYAQLSTQPSAVEEHANLRSQNKAQSRSHTQHEDPAAACKFVRKIWSEIGRREVDAAFYSYSRLFDNPLGRKRITHKMIRSLLGCVRQSRQDVENYRMTIRLLEDMRQLSIPLDNRDFNHLISAYTKLGNDEAVHSVLAEMQSHGLCPDVTTYNVMFSGFARAGKIDALRKGIAQMRAACIKPDLVTYNTMLSALASNIEEQDIQELVSLVKSMEQDGVQPDAQTYNLLIKGHIRGGHINSAMTLLGKMVDAGFGPNLLTYTNIVAGLLREGDISRAETHFHAMVGAGYEPPAWVYERFIIACARQKKRESAEMWYKDMRHKGLPPTVNSLLALVRLAAGEHDLAAVQQWLLTRKSFIVTEEDYGSFYRVVIQELLKCNGLELIPEVHKLLLQFGCLVDQRVEENWRQLHKERSSKDSGRKQMLVDEAPLQSESRRIKEDVADNGPIADIITANRRIASLAKSSKSFPQALALFKSLHRLSLAPTAATYSPMLAAYARAGEVDELRELWQQMRERQVVPDAACYSALVQGYLHGSLVDEASDALDDLRKSHIKPTPVTTRLRIEVALAKMRYSEATDLVIDVCRQQVIEAYRVINATVERLCQAGKFKDAIRCWDATKDIVSHAKMEGGTDRLIRYPSVALLVHGLLGSGEIDLALQIYKDAVECGMSFEENVILSMAQALNSKRDRKNLSWVLEDAVKKRITPTHAAWDSVADILKDFDGQLGAGIIADVIGVAARKPSPKEAGKIIFTCLWRKSAEELCRWYHVFSAHDVKLDVSVYATIFGSQRIHWPKEFLNRCLKDLIQESRQASGKVEAHIFVLALESIIASGDGKGVWRAYSTLRKRGELISKSQYGRIMDALCACGMTSQAERLLQDAGDDADAGMYASLLIPYAKQNSTEHMERVLSQIMPHETYQCYPAISRALLEAVEVGQTGSGFYLLERMLDAGMEISEHLYISLISKMADLGETSLVIEVVCRIIAAGIVPDVIVHNLIIKSYIRAGKPREAMSVLENIDGNVPFSTEPDAWAFNNVIAGLAKAGDAEGVEAVKKKMRKFGIEADLVTYTALLAGVRNPKDVERLQTAMGQDGVEPDIIFTRALASRYAKLGYPRICEGVVCTSKSIMDTWGWNIILEGWKEVGDYWQCVRKYQEMRKKGEVIPDAVTINTLIAAAMGSPQVVNLNEEVDRWMAEMSQLRIEPTGVTRTLLIQQAARVGDAELAVRRFNALVRAGIKPDEGTFAVLLGAYVQNEYAANVEWVVKEMMPSHGIVPTRVTYDIVMGACSKEGRVNEVKEWMERMEKEGYAPDEAAWRHLVAAHIARGDLVGAEAAMMERVKASNEQVANPLEIRRTSLVAPQVRENVDVHLLHMLANGYCEKELYQMAITSLSKVPRSQVDAITVSLAMKVCVRGRWMEEGEMLWRWATDGLVWEGGRVGFLTGRKWRRVESAVNESFVCSYLDLVGLRASISAQHEQVRKAWEDVLRLEKGEKRGEEFLRGHFPSENMLNSYVEGLMRCGDYGGGLRVLRQMDGELYSARPSAKTIRTIVGFLSGRSGFEGKVRQMVERRWKDLAGVAWECSVSTCSTE